MKFFVFTTTLLIGISLRTYSSNANQFTCDPVTDCSDATNPGDKVPNPDNCTQYELCLLAGDGTLYPSDDPLDCPSGQYFNWDAADCVDDEGDGCRNLCINLCNLSCTAQGDLLADPSGCGNYYFCTSDSDSDKLETSCPVDYPYFDGIRCQNDSQKCCDTCTPYCSEEYTETQDPYDCTKYYICLYLGIPDEKDLHSCPDGQQFDNSEGRCVDGTDCESFCSEFDYN